MIIEQAIEALLFTAGKAVSFKALAKLVDASEEDVAKAVEALSEKYKEAKSGLSLTFDEKQVELVTSGDASKVVGDFLKDETTGELTRPSLETLTIIAYRGPVGKAEIELIRGVNCSLILRNLRIRGLIEEDMNDVGLPEYKVSLDFMKFLGISSVKELPDFEHLSANERLQDLLENEDWFKAQE